ncbi:MAG: hypothetical protein ACTH93_09150 [Pseudoclavibacter sp.]
MHSPISRDEYAKLHQMARYLTPLDEHRQSLGDCVVAVGRAMRTPLIPWQRYAAQLSREIDPDTGTFYYDRIVITTPRQVGKTTLDAATSIQTCLMAPDREAWYMAQDGQHGDERFRQKVFPVWKKSPLAALGPEMRKSNGSMWLGFVNGSRWGPAAPTDDGMHGKQGDQVTIDEAWAHTEAQGRAIVQAVLPTQITRKQLTGHQPQTWIISTEGTVESTWYNPILDSLRESVPERTAFIDFGIRDDVDPEDLRAVAAVHPGFGHLFDANGLRAFRTQFGSDAAGFARAFGNRRTGSSQRVIDPQLWAAGRTLTPIPDDAPLCIGAAVGVDAVDTAITATGTHPELGSIAEVVEQHPGVAWAFDRLMQLQDEHDAPIAIDSHGPSAALRDQLDRAGARLVDMTSNAVTASCQTIMTGLETGTWHYRPHPALDGAADLAARRWISDGAWAWGRRASVGSIAALEAATCGEWGVTHLPKVTGLQLF